MEKTTVFNLIILDESGSMQPNTKVTIAGCNENLNVIRSLQKENSDTQRFLTSIYAFQGGNPESPSRYIIKNEPIENVKDITENDYRPWGNTPLLDAVGTTLHDLISVAKTHQDAVASVTIITDGYENSSVEFSPRQVADLIKKVKDMGWNVNLIGANIDVDSLGDMLNIDSKMKFDSTESGTMRAMEELNSCTRSYHANRMSYEKELCELNPCMDEAELKKQKLEKRKMFNKNFFKK